MATTSSPPDAVRPRVEPGAVELELALAGQVMRVPIHRVAERPLGEAYKGLRMARLADAAEGRPALRLDGGGALVDAATGHLVAVYLEPPAHPAPTLAATLGTVKPIVNHRQNGLYSAANVFGYMPRKKGRQDWCRATRFETEFPDKAAALDALGVDLGELYRQAAPALHAWQVGQLGALLPDYKKSAVYTSGIVNYDNPLAYHYDAGNLPHTWSAMLGLKRRCTGGELVLPAYNAILPVADGSIVLFDGQAVLHGVAPFSTLAGGYRLTVVWYTLQQLWQCLAPAEELARFQVERTKQERKRRAASQKGAR